MTSLDMALHRSAENTVLARNRKHLAGHEGREMFDSIFVHLHPFAVGAGENEKLLR